MSRRRERVVWREGAADGALALRRRAPPRPTSPDNTTFIVRLCNAYVYTLFDVISLIFLLFAVSTRKSVICAGSTMGSLSLLGPGSLYAEKFDTITISITSRYREVCLETG